MLRDTNLAIDEIGRRCGYQSLPSFTRRFKVVFGEGPGAFRRGLRSNR
jgi:AraC-like DNA-binding protein